MRDMLLVLDFDREAAKRTVRMLRNERICCRIVPADITPDEIRAQEALGLIVAGGRASGRPVGEGVLSVGLPVLALSNASGWLCSVLGGEVSDDISEHALETVCYEPCTLLNGLFESDKMLGTMHHLTLPDSAIVLAYTKDEHLPVIFSNSEQMLFGVTFEPEVHDPDDQLMLANFAKNVCGCTGWWDEEAFVTRSKQEIRRIAGNREAFCAMTGGLSSGTAALIAHNALGDKLHCVFVDTGLLREGEADRFMDFYVGHMGMNIKRVDASERFLSALQGIKDQREKRAKISALFTEILDSEYQLIGPDTLIVRGTNADDAASVKDKDNEFAPLSDLLKDEIRTIGNCLGLTPDIIHAQPFPGSGLALRISGEVTAEKLRTLRTADRIFAGLIEENGLQKRLRQYYAVLNEIDENHCQICLRAIQASEQSAVYPARLPYDVVESVSGEIMCCCTGVHQVVLDMTVNKQM